jgi:TetR/AcrR family transcriptional regulator, cholesterol catabolism regulator
MDTVLQLLESEGYDAVSVREVAKRARISLVTLYSLYPSRDELIVSAVEEWLKENVFNQEVTIPPDATMSEALIQFMTTVMKPWEEHPLMLEALFKARESPGSERLLLHGVAFAGPVLAPVFRDVDPEFVADINLIIRHVNFSVMAQCASGGIPITDLLPIMERTINRLTSEEHANKRTTWPWGQRQRRKAKSTNSH